jgi:hypothetical protein
MGRHVNADAGSDEGEALELAESADRDDTSNAHEHARHVAESGQLLEPQAVISPDTHVGADLGSPAYGTEKAAASPANPDALIEHGRVGDGHEME